MRKVGLIVGLAALGGCTSLQDKAFSVVHDEVVTRYCKEFNDEDRAFFRSKLSSELGPLIEIHCENLVVE